MSDSDLHSALAVQAEFIACFERAAIAAGAVIMNVFESDDDHRLKADRSPVTLADERAEKIICEALETHFPDIPIVAEERVSAGIIPDDVDGVFFLVDPLDGTREFINRRKDFTVNIALIADGEPCAGVVFAPASGSLYTGGREGAFHARVSGSVQKDRKRIETRKKAAFPIAVASRSHNSPETDAFLKDRNITEIVSIGSSLKFCLLAEGKADIYPRFGRTMEWDTAAGDAVLRAAGGRTLRFDGAPFVYGKRNQPDDTDFANPHFIAIA